jgi:hypothetical protein
MSVLIALPCYNGNVSEQTTIGLFNLGKELTKRGIEHGILTLSNESLISRGRSRIVNFYVNNTSFEYLFFLDADIGFSVDDFFTLWDNRDLKMVSGCYPMKNLPLQFNFNLVSPLNKIRNDIVEITGIGLGFSLLSREIFVSVMQSFPELKYRPVIKESTKGMTEDELNNSYHYFHERKVGDCFLPEDHSFFSRAVDCGYKSWLCSSVTLAHTGYYIFGEKI